MAVGIVGDGKAAAAVESALADVDVETRETDASGVGTTDVTVVVGRAGDTVFERANEQALAANARWIGVELGGIGGFPVVDAAVAGFGPDTGCYECLSGRVNANLVPDTEPAAAPAAHTARFAGAIAGREVARHVVDESDIFGRVVEVPHAFRAFFPLPNCACDETSPAPIDREHVDRDVEASLALAERAVDERVGLVQEVGEAESFPAPYYLAHGCDTAGFSDASAGRDAAGVSADWNAAFVKAIGESLERYCAGVYRTDSLTSATPEAVTDAVEPSAFVCAETPEDAVEIPWVAGSDLHADERASLPAEFVYYPPPSRRFRPPVTTGLGLGNGTVDALLSGLSEVIERDAAMLAWYSTFDPLGLAVDDEAFETLAGRARSEGLSVSTVLLTQDVDVPVVAAAVHRDSWPRFAIGSSANLDATAGARSALCEALQNWMELRGMGPEDAGGAAGAIGRYAESPEEAVAFFDSDGAVPAESVGPSESPTGEAALDALLDRLDDAGLAAYAARLTTRDVDRLGFEAVRALVPSAQPLFFGDAYFGERAQSVPKELGFEPRTDRSQHPFP